MDSNESDYLIDTEISLSRSVRFWLLLLFDIPSITCSLFLLYYFLTKNNLRSALNNHAIIALLFTGLFTQLIDIPLYLNFLHLGFVWPQTLTTCVIWWYAGTAMYNTGSILVAWLSFERHILVFHDKYVSTRKTQWLFHYIPIIFFLIYPMIFYLLVLLIPSCEERFVYDYNQDWCGLYPCYYNDSLLSLIDLIINFILPCLLILFFSITLLMRSIWTKHIRLHRTIQWRKYRKMIIQLLSISLLFCLFYLPSMIYYLLYVIQYLPKDIDPYIELYLIFIAYFSMLLLPFVILLLLPNDFCQNEWRKFINYIRRNRASVTPMIIATSNIVEMRRLRAMRNQDRLAVQ